MSIVVVYMRPDGGMSEMYPAPNCPMALEDIIAKDVPAGCKWKIMDTSELPQDRSLRDAWELDAEFRCNVNRGKAEEAVRNNLRVERGPRLQELDVLAVREMESGAISPETLAKKQALRDVTLVDMSDMTLEELAALTLDQALEKNNATGQRR